MAFERSGIGIVCCAILNGLINKNKGAASNRVDIRQTICLPKNMRKKENIIVLVAHI